MGSWDVVALMTLLVVAFGVGFRTGVKSERERED